MSAIEAKFGAGEKPNSLAFRNISPRSSSAPLLTQMSFPEMVSDRLCRNYLVVQTHSFISCPGGWSQTIPQLKKPGCGGLGLACLHVVCSVGRTAKFSKMMLEVTFAKEINTKFSANSSGGHSCSQHANCTLPQNLRLLEAHLFFCLSFFFTYQFYYKMLCG